MRRQLLWLTVLVAASSFLLLTCHGRQPPSPPPDYRPPLCTPEQQYLMPEYQTMSLTYILCQDSSYQSCQPDVNMTLYTKFNTTGIAQYEATMFEKDPTYNIALIFFQFEKDVTYGGDGEPSIFFLTTEVDEFVEDSTPVGWFLTEQVTNTTSYGYTFAASFEPVTSAWEKRQQSILWNGYPDDTSSKLLIMFQNSSTLDTCMMTIDVTITCCTDKLPPILVEQPYWILVASTITYFFAAYIWVAIMTCLDKFECWRRWCHKMKSRVGMTSKQIMRRRIRPVPSTPLVVMTPAYPPTRERDTKLTNGSISLESTNFHSYQQDLPASAVKSTASESMQQQLRHPLMDPADRAESDLMDGYAEVEDGNGVVTELQVDQIEILPSDRSLNTTNNDNEAQGTYVYEDYEETIAMDDLPILTMSDRLARANALYLAFQLMIVTGNFIYLIIRFQWMDDAPMDANKSFWWKYQRIYMFWNNSSQTTLLASAVASYFLQKWQIYAQWSMQGRLPFRQVWTRTCAHWYTCSCWCRSCRLGYTRFKLFWGMVPETQLTRRIAKSIIFLNMPAILSHVLPMWVLFGPGLVIIAFLLFLLAGLVYYVFAWSQRTAVKAFTGLAAYVVTERETWLKNRTARREQLVKQVEEAAERAKKEEQATMDGTTNGDATATTTTDGETHPTASDGDAEEQKQLYSGGHLTTSTIIADSTEITPLAAVVTVVEETTDEIRSECRMEDMTTFEIREQHFDREGEVRVEKPLNISVSFPWYAVLLLRLMCTIIVVVFFQTCFNYAYIIYSLYAYNVDAVEKYFGDWNTFQVNVWGQTIQNEYLSRGTQQWLEGMEASFHQFLVQISLFV